MNELRVNFSCLNSKAEDVVSINDIRRGRSRILSLYKSQNIQNHPERRRSFLKVFSKQNKGKTSSKNINHPMLKDQTRGIDQKIKKINCKIEDAYLILADKECDKQSQTHQKFNQKLQLSKAFERQFLSQRITLQPRKAAHKKSIIHKKINMASHEFTKDTSHSDFRSDVSTITFKNTNITKLSFIKSQTPVNYLTMLDEEDPNENEDNVRNPFINY